MKTPHSTILNLSQQILADQRPQLADGLNLDAIDDSCATSLLLLSSTYATLSETQATLSQVLASILRTR
jgi:hypothetical protein